MKYDFEIVKKYFFLVLIFILFACNTSETKNTSVSKYSYRLESTDKILKIPIDIKTTNITTSLFYLENFNQRLILFLNESNQTVYFFDIDSLKEYHKIKIDREGPNGIPRVLGIQAKNMDTLYVSNATNDLFIIDSKGKLIKKINFKRTYDNLPTKTFYTSIHRQSLVLEKEGKIFLIQYPGVSFNTITNDNLNKFQLGLEIDTLNNRISYLPFYFPVDYFNLGKVEPMFGWCLSKNKFIISFNCDHRIYVTDDFSNITIHDAKSDFIRKFEYVPMSGINTIIDIQKYSIKAPLYKSIIYDPYRDVYYRFAYPGIEPDKSMNFGQVARYKPSFSIIILNKRFEKIGETELLNNKFYMDQFFITKEGLYISLDSPFNPEYDENSLNFKLFELKKNEK